MAHEGIFATKAEVDAAVGENVDATGWTEANINAWCLHSESLINAVCTENYSDTYGTLNADKKYILTLASASYVAIQGITYNMSGYTSRIEAEDMINIHRDNLLRALSILKNKTMAQVFINAA